MIGWKKGVTGIEACIKLTLLSLSGYKEKDMTRFSSLVPAGIDSCQLITDDGSENAGPVKELMVSYPSITHLIAQRDIEFSNSMIEAANKQLKYHFLYHQHIPNHEALVKFVSQAIEDFNNQPHSVLQGLTTLEVLNRKKVDKTGLCLRMAISKVNRIAENKKAKCCYYSF